MMMRLGLALAALMLLTVPALPQASGDREAFLAGTTKDCPGCDLAGVRIKGRDLSGGNLAGADLSGATLRHAKLERAVFNDAKLTDADFSGARLNFAWLSDSEQTGTIWNGATMPDGTVHE